MQRTLLILIVATVFLPSCRDAGNPTGAVSGPGLPALSGKFVVDSFAVDYGLRRNPNTDSINAAFPFTLRYHFEGCPGSVDEISLVVVGFEGIFINIDYASPDSVNRPITFSSVFWARDLYQGVDSVVIECYASGSYWTLTDDRPNFLGSFDWYTQVTVPIRGG